MTGRVQNLGFVLCLLLRTAFGDFALDDLHLVDGLVNQQITLPCSLTVPDNWKDDEIHIVWYKNFTNKLMDCVVRNGMMPVCQEHLDSPRAQLSWKFPGNADLNIYDLQESDEGQYQCWIMFNDAYQRQYFLLHIHSDTSTKTGSSPFQGIVSWHVIVVVSTLNGLLVSGWPFVFLLALILLSKRCQSHRKKKCIII